MAKQDQPVADPVVDPPIVDPVVNDPPAEDDPVIDPPVEKTPEQKAADRAAYETRKLKQDLEAARKENEQYKLREENKRKEALTEQERVIEERNKLAAENETLKLQNLRSKIGSEFKLPVELSSLLVGSDEESMRLHAEALAKYAPKARVGNTTDPVRDRATQVTYTRAQLAADPALARSQEVALAAKEGRIVG